MRGQASGVVQTVRNFGSALGVAILGTVLLTVQQDNIKGAIEKVGIPPGEAEAIAAKVLAAGAGEKPAGARGDLSGPVAQRIGDAFESTFAEAVQAAFYVGAGIVAVGFLIVVLFMPSGRQKIEE